MSPTGPLGSLPIVILPRDQCWIPFFTSFTLLRSDPSLLSSLCWVICMLAWHSATDCKAGLSHYHCRYPIYLFPIDRNIGVMLDLSYGSSLLLIFTVSAVIHTTTSNSSSALLVIRLLKTPLLNSSTISSHPHLICILCGVSINGLNQIQLIN